MIEMSTTPSVRRRTCTPERRARCAEAEAEAAGGGDDGGAADAAAGAGAGAGAGTANDGAGAGMIGAAGAGASATGALAPIGDGGAAVGGCASTDLATSTALCAARMRAMSSTRVALAAWRRVPTSSSSSEAGTPRSSPQAAHRGEGS
ncbi:hypothetical protein GCM10009748_01850 [Agromyces lapidis]